MKTFQDNESRNWELAVNVDAVKRVKAHLEVDLLEAVEGNLLERLVGDPVLLCDVIYVICKPQAEAAGVSDEDFGRAMAGDAIDAATMALLEDLVDFFPRARRQVLQKALTKLRKLEAMTLDAATKALDSDALEKILQAELADHDIEAFVRERLAEARSSATSLPKNAGGQSTSSPVQPASNPDR